MHECDCGSCVHATVPWLSQYSGVALVWWKPSSLNSDCCQRICHAQCEHAIYSASQDDNATTTCCLELQAMMPPPPLINNLIYDLAGYRLFSKFDVQWEYNNIHIKKGDE